MTQRLFGFQKFKAVLMNKFQCENWDLVQYKG